MLREIRFRGIHKESGVSTVLVHSPGASSYVSAIALCGIWTLTCTGATF